MIVHTEMRKCKEAVKLRRRSDEAICRLVPLCLRTFLVCQSSNVSPNLSVFFPLFCPTACQSVHLCIFLVHTSVCLAYLSGFSSYPSACLSVCLVCLSWHYLVYFHCNSVFDYALRVQVAYLLLSLQNSMNRVPTSPLLL